MTNYFDKAWNALKWPAAGVGLYLATEGFAELYQGPKSIEPCLNPIYEKHVPANTDIYSDLAKAHRKDTLRYGDKTLLITDISRNDPVVTGVESNDVTFYVTGYDTKTGKRVDINQIPLIEGRNISLNGSEGTLTLGEVFPD
jgi:hypothetical protein